MYVFDTNVFSQLFKSYYQKTFPSLWESFDALVEAGEITSTREVLRELADREAHQHQETWLKENKSIFPSPDATEGAFVTKIFTEPHFLQVIELKKIQKGGKNADPFVVARAGVLGAAVVTNERFKDKAAKIPNICQQMGVTSYSLEEFMEEEGWVF